MQNKKKEFLKFGLSFKFFVTLPNLKNKEIK